MGGTIFSKSPIYVTIFSKVPFPWPCHHHLLETFTRALTFQNLSAGWKRRRRCARCIFIPPCWRLFRVSWYVCKCVGVRESVCVFVCVFVCVWVCAWMHTRARTHPHTHSHTHTHTHTHTHAHTHTQSPDKGLYLSDCPYNKAYYNVYRAGDGLGWHFDKGERKRLIQEQKRPIQEQKRLTSTFRAPGILTKVRE